MRRKLTSLKLSAIAAVDNPCQEGAKVALMKRREDPAPDPEALAAIAKYVGREDGAHTFSEVLRENRFSEAIWPLTHAFTQAVQSIVGDTSISRDDRDAKITTSTAQFLTSVRALEPDIEKQLLQLVQKERPMPKTIQELEAELAKANGQIETLTSERDTHKATAETEKARADKAEGELATAKARVDELEKAAPDETITIEGQTVSKRAVGETQFAIFKAQDQRLQKAEEERAVEKATTRATTDFANLPGTPAEKGAALHALAGLAEPVRNTIEAVFTSAEKMVRSGFDRIGLANPASPTAKAANDAFMAKVAEIQTRDNCGRAAAMSKARREHQDLFEAMSASN